MMTPSEAMIPAVTPTRFRPGTIGDDWIGLVNSDREGAYRSASAKIPHAAFVAFDLLAHSSELAFDVEYLGKFSGAIREQLDEPLLETARIGDARLHVDELLADVLHGHVHRLELSDGREAIHRFVEAIRGNAQLERRGAGLLTTAGHRGVRDDRVGAPRHLADALNANLERDDLQRGLTDTHEHAAGANVLSRR